MEDMVKLSKELALYKGKKVLVTGHTGFKGSWLCIWLKELGADVIGYALDPYTQDDNFVLSRLTEKVVDVRGDVRDYTKLQNVFSEHSPEIVFHLAAQSLVLDGYSSPRETYDVNVGGTVNVLECCRLSQSVATTVIVTSDKCYDNREWVWGYRETDALGGDDPYSSSKACAELVTHAYKQSYFNANESRYHGMLLASVRAGNVIGGSDWRENRIVPDCIRAFEKGESLLLRKPQAVRPWQFVLEPLGGYLMLAAKMMAGNSNLAGAWNFGPQQTALVSVHELVSLIFHDYGSGEWQTALSEEGPKETHVLALDIGKAMNILGWRPLLSLEQAVRMTVQWYKNYRTASDMYGFCAEQIKEYMEAYESYENN